jgi:glucose-6-phosphate-specific signal transduction histidine kinase
MIIISVDGLIRDIEVSFGLPAIGFALALINIRFTPRSKFNALKLRFSLTFVLLLFAYLIGNLMYQDRAVLLSLWADSPILYSLVYTLSGVLVLTSIIAVYYWKLRPELWRRKAGGPE